MARTIRVPGTQKFVKDKACIEVIPHRRGVFPFIYLRWCIYSYFLRPFCKKNSVNKIEEVI